MKPTYEFERIIDIPIKTTAHTKALFLVGLPVNFGDHLYLVGEESCCYKTLSREWKLAFLKEFFPN